MGFTLAVKNAPNGSVYWSAQYHGGIYSTGLLSLDEAWNNPNPASGETDLLVWAMRSDYSIIAVVANLGPVNNEKSYIFDFATQILSLTGWVRMVVAPTYVSISKITAGGGWVRMVDTPTLLTIAKGLPSGGNWVRMVDTPTLVSIKQGATPPPSGGGSSMVLPLVLIGGGAAIAIALATKPAKSTSKSSKKT